MKLTHEILDNKQFQKNIEKLSNIYQASEIISTKSYLDSAIETANKSISDNIYRAINNLTQFITSKNELKLNESGSNKSHSNIFKERYNNNLDIINQRLYELKQLIDSKLN